MFNVRFYDYNQLIKTVETLYETLSSRKITEENAPLIEICGYSELGRPIIAIMDKSPKILLQGATHAREHITGRLLDLLLTDYFINRTTYTTAIEQGKMKDSMVKIKRGFCFIPLANPDGADICINGTIEPDLIQTQINKMLNAVANYNNLTNSHGTNFINVNTAIRIQENRSNLYLDGYYKYVTEKYNLINRVRGDAALSLWKANANCVDINNNFDAKWGHGLKNTNKPSSEGYIGEYPNSEKETRTLVSITEKLRFEYTLSYHARGNVMYYGFNGKDPMPDVRIKIAALLDIPMYIANNSVGGYKDYFVDKYSKGGITLEVGSDSSEEKSKKPRQYLDLYAELPLLYTRHKEIIKYLSLL